MGINESMCCFGGRAGWHVNRKRVYRLYRMEGLSLYQRYPERSRAAQQRQENPQVTAIDECWSMDFVSDQLFDGRKLRAMTLIDRFTRECLSIWVD
jgi:putative transposase